MTSANPRSWEGLRLGAAIAAVLAVGFFVASRFVSPAPPRTIQMAAGPASGAYALFAERYGDALHEYGITLRIEHTPGSEENLALLRSGRAELGFVQTGVASASDQTGLQALGSVLHEPLWLFLRSDLEAPRLSALRGLLIDVGSPGSGTRALTESLLRLNGVTSESSTWVDRGESGWEQALADGELDAIFLVSSIDSPRLRALFEHPGLRLRATPRAEAYTRVNRSLSRVVLPEGVVDFARNVPATDTELVSAMGQLVAGPNLHPALVDLLLQAARDVHGRGDVFAEPGTMPTPHFIDLPLHTDAERFYLHGPPFLQRYLPFWAATQIDRLMVMLIPVIALLIPLLRVFPPTYRWRIRSRIYRWYRELREADPTPGVVIDAGELAERLTTIARIEEEVAKVPVPPSYAAELYSLELHIEFVRRRLNAIHE